MKKNDLIKEISIMTGVDQRVVRLVADYPLKFSRDRMSDPDDWRAIMIRYFCKFVPKNKILKQLKEDGK